jgi:hypothetical protein
VAAATSDSSSAIPVASVGTCIAVPPSPLLVSTTTIGVALALDVILAVAIGAASAELAARGVVVVTALLTTPLIGFTLGTLAMAASEETETDVMKGTES